MRDVASKLGFQCTITLVDSLDQDVKESLASVRMEGLGALHAAAMKSNVEICRYLVEVLKFDINSVDRPESGGTPLIFAASDGQVAAVRYLLDKGADPNKQDHQGYAPLHEAAKEATYLINRLPSTASPAPTPHHALFGTPPRYDHLRVFGCACYPNTSATAPHKLAPRSTRCVFLGYSPDHKGYRCFDLMSRRVLISGHVSTVYHPPVLERDPRHLHPMVTRRAAGVLRPAALSTAAAEPGISPVPSSVRDALADPHWRRAMEEEYTALLANQTWDLVPPPPGGNVVTGKWIWTHKRRADGTLDRYKARWVLRGFTQRPGVDYDETFSPVVKPATVRTVLSLALSRSWPVHQLDVKNAFLHGTLTETVYCSQPAGFVDPTRPDMAPRAWYSRFATFLVTLGFTEAKSDTSLFIYRHVDEMAYLLLYVDDIVLTASENSLLRRIITSLQQRPWRAPPLLGCYGRAPSLGLLLHRRRYTLDIPEHVGMADCNPRSTPVDTRAKLSEDAGPPACRSYRLP
ncbi:hypothetical protein U9M48_010165 [Paspalum notatum var. saurae]|uniref:Uncharacterized protein n=1 Tax=Paspalum notatum var. saurae TaxID=547442 RepID=A0AAQ3WFY2_PASNO